MAYAAVATAEITNLFSDECYPPTHPATVDWTNPYAGYATINVSCSCGGAVTPNPPPSYGPGPGSGTVTFTITHIGTGAGHRIVSEVVVGSNRYPGGEVTVNVGDPCPIVAPLIKKSSEDMPLADINADLAGTFDAKLGNAIILLVEEPAKNVQGVLTRPRLTFASPAVVEIDGATGKWKHPALKKSRKGQHLRIVLTKDGMVISIIRARLMQLGGEN